MFKKFRMASMLAGMAMTARVTEDAPAATAPDAATAVATIEVPAAADPVPVGANAATVAVAVPVAHVGLFQRVVALLEKEEQTIVDNIHAGVSALEAMFGKDEKTE